MASRKSWVKQALKQVRAGGPPRKAAPKRLGVVQLEDRVTPVVFSNPNPITINNLGNSTPYPVPITVSGLTGPLTNLTVTLNNLSHTFPDDVDILLVAPGDKASIVMSNAGDGTDANNLTFTFSDAAAGPLPDSGALASGTYMPTNYVGSADNWPGAPAGPYPVSFATFNGINPNGTWNLYVTDDSSGDGGSIANGWSLDINTFSAPNTVYVDPSFTTIGTPVDGDNTTAGSQAATVGTDAFSTIPAAFAAVASGGTIIVNGLTPGATPNVPYATNLSITKPVTLSGKSLPVVGSAVNSPTTAAGDVFRVLSDDVAIDGFAVGGPGTRRGVTNVQADGLTLVPVNNAKITNNTFTGTGGAAVRFNSNNAPTTGLLVQNNTVSKYGAANPTGEGNGIHLVGDAYGTVTGNTVTVPDFTTDLFVGVYVFNYTGAGSLGITNNTVAVGKVGAGIYVQAAGGAGQTVSITGNTVQGGAGTASGDDAWGIDTLFAGGGTLTVAGNAIGGGAGFLDFGLVLESSTGVTVGAGNTITGGKVGLKATGATTLVGNTIADTQFTGQTAQHIALESGAFAGVEINGTGAKFNGLTGGTATLAQNFGIEDKITHATDVDTVGFVRVRAGVVYVTDLSDSVARGAKILQAGNTLKAQSGTYTEPYPIEVKVAAVIDGEGKATTIVTPGYVAPNAPAGDMVRVLADGVTVQDFTFDGQFDARRGLTNYKGTGPAATPVNNLVVQNNSFTGFGGAAIVVTNAGTAAVTTGLSIIGNAIAGFGDAVDAEGILLGQDVGGSIKANAITVPGGPGIVNIGVYVTGYAAAALAVEFNTVTVGEGGSGIYAEGVFAPAAVSVNANAVAAGAGLTAAQDAWGIDVTSSDGVTVTANTLGGGTGVLAFGLITDLGADVAYTGNSVTGAAAAHKVAGGGTATLTDETYIGGVDGLVIEATGLLGSDSLGDTVFSAQSGQHVVLESGAYLGKYIDGTAASYNGVLGGAGVTAAQSFAIEDKLFHATDDDTTGYVVVKPGFVAVTDNSDSIARAAKVAKPGDVIQVQAGLYNEPYAIVLSDVGVSVAGPGKGLATSQPLPTFNDPFTAAGDMIRVLADDVSLTGVTYDGLGQLRRGLTNYGGTGPAATPVNDLSVTANAFTGFGERAVAVTNTGTAAVTTGLLISGNSFADYGQQVDADGVFLAQDVGGTVTGNTFVVPGTGINSGVYVSGYTAAGLTVSANTVTVEAGGVGIYVEDGTGGTVAVTGNTVNATTGLTAAADAWGIDVVSSPAGVTVTGNTVGTAGGVLAYGIIADLGTVTTLTANATGAKADVGYKIAGGAAATLAGINTATGGRIGIRVEDAATKLGGDTLGTTQFTGLTAQNVVLANAAYFGAYVTGTAAKYDGVVGGAGVTTAQSFAIEDKLFHATDDDTVGYVVYKPGFVNVTDNSDSIARAAKVLKANETIRVAAGVYNEPYAILLDDVGVTVAGPGAGLATSQPLPAFNDPFSSAGDMIRVLADNVTVADVTYDGLGQLRRGLTNYSGTGPAATPILNLLVSSNTFQNFAGRGISVTNAGNPAGTLSTVDLFGNTLTNFGVGADSSGETVGIFLAQDVYGFVTANTLDVADGPFLASEGFQGTNTGIFIADYGSGTASDVLLVGANTITVGKDTTGVFINGVTGGGQSIIVLANTIDSNAGVTAANDAWGVGVYNVFAPGVFVESNDIGQASAGTLTNGIALFNVGDDLVVVESNTVGKSQNGIQVYGVEPFDLFDAGPQTVELVDNVVITVAGGFGVVANDDSAPGTGTSVYVESATLTNNLKGAGTGAAVNGGDAFLYLTKQNVSAATPLGGVDGFYLQLEDTVLSGTGPSTVDFSGAGSRFQITATTLGVVTDTFAIPGTSVQYNTSSKVNFTGLGTLDIYGEDGNDSFSVSPNVTDKTVINIFGGDPQLVTPGDTLDLNLVALIGDPTLTVPTPGLPDGSVTAATAGTVNWTSIETLPIPLGLGGSFDFNKEAYVGVTAPEFRGVIPTDSFAAGKYAGAAGYLPSTGYSFLGGFDRKDLGQTPNVPAPWADLYRDGHWGYDGDFGAATYRVAVSTAQAVQLTLSVGDTYFLRDKIEIYTGNPAVPASMQKIGVLESKTGEFNVFSVVLDNPGLFDYADNFLDITIRDAGGYSFWTWNYLDVRPVTLVNDLILTPAAPANVPADGTTVSNYAGTGARPSGLVTISSTYGTVLNDAAPAVLGAQVLADAAGNFTFQIQSPLSATALVGPQAGSISASEVTGFGKTKVAVIQGYDAGTAAGKNTRFDFNGPAGVTAAGFTGVRGADLYSPTLGYGWAAATQEFERTAADTATKGAATTDLYADGAWGNGTTPGTFQVAVAKGAAVNARGYFGDSYNRWRGTSFEVEGGTGPVVVDLVTKNFAVLELAGSDANNDGVFWVRVSNQFAGRIWAMTGLDIAEGGLPPALPQLSRLSFTSPSRVTLTDAQLAPIVDAAIARWVAAGITPAQEAKLRAAAFRIADLDALGRLGEAGFGQIAIDDNANGQGWFIDPTPLADEEFVNGAARARTAAGRMDLLTVVMHELGRELGWDSVPAATFGTHVMADTLTAGVRRGASTADLSTFFAPYVDGNTATRTSGSVAVAATDLKSEKAETVVAAPAETAAAKKAKARALALSIDDAALAPWVG